MRKPKITMRRVKLAFSMAILVSSSLAVFHQGRESLKYPLLGHHCMKTSKSIEVSYNLVRYGDPSSQYVDWQATPVNPRGKLGSIFRYESPLSAFVLAGLYLIVDGSDFSVRVNAARYFTLASLIAAYLLIGFFVFREDPFALLCFSFFVTTSFFTISYSTKPQAETFAVLYQAISVIFIARLLRLELKPFFKSAAIVGMAGLLCLGGKMNYFIIAFPVAAVYPFLDDRLKGVSNKLQYYALFAGTALAGALVLVFSTDFNFTDTFIYFIKGNKPVIEDSLWKTFMEGFEGFSEVWERTRAHFGSVAFGAGIYSSLYLSWKFVCFFIRKGKRAPTPFESFQLVLFLFIVGHCLNYMVLRNLYIPHRYYVVPLYFLFCLSFAAVLADIRSFDFAKSGLKQRIFAVANRMKITELADRFKSGEERTAHLYCFVRLAVIAYALSFAAGYLAEELSGDEELRSSYIHTLKYLGNKAPAYKIDMLVASRTAVLGQVSHWLFWFSTVFLAANLAAFFVFSKNDSFRKPFVSVDRLFQRAGISAAGSALAVFLIVISAITIVQNGEMHFAEEEFQKDKIELADRLEKIRNNTKSGDLVLCWKWCVAFYADKRSITDAKETDIDYYVKHRIDSVLGPKRPLDLYYKRLKNYPSPATYWTLRSAEEISRVKEQRMKRGVFGKPVNHKEGNE